MDSIQCSKCDTSFQQVSRWRDSTQCIECYRKYQREYQAKRRIKRREYNDFIRTCPKCGVTITEDNTKPGYTQCKPCYNKLTHDWYIRNKQQVRDKHNDRYKTDAKFKEYRNYKRAITRITDGTQKDSKLINFKPIEMFAWLQFICGKLQLDFKMVENKTLIIDHVVPLNEGLQNHSLWDMVIGWWNMSPLQSKQNLSKNNRVDNIQLAIHHGCLMEYTRTNKINNPLIEAYLTYLQDTSQCRETRKASNTTQTMETSSDTQGNDLGHGNSVEDDELTASLSALSL